MPKSSNQKLKILYLYKILAENTDENNPMTMPKIISALEKYGVSAERKSVYSDIELLVNEGVDIVSEKRDRFVYYIASRNFQLAELKLLVDCVQASKFITAKKSAELIGKLEKLASKNQATELRRQVYISDRVKTFNERIYYNIDLLHSAVNSGMKIQFKYYQYNTEKASKLKNNGEYYTVSPYGLVYSDDNYYLLVHYPKYDGLSHFRVDKMTDITIVDEKAEPIENITNGKFSLAEYTKKVFNMFHGRTETVQLRCDESIVNVVIDKFGENVFLRKESEGVFVVTAKADVSPAFYSWIFMLGTKIEILSPDTVVAEYQDMLRENLSNYLS